MKTLEQFSLKAAPLAAAVSLVLFAGNLRALGPVGAGNAGSTNGGVTTGGVVAGGGSRGGSLTTGNAGGRSSAPAASGARNGVSYSNSGVRASAGPSTQGTGIRGNAPSSLSQPYRNALNGPSPVFGTRPAASQAASRPNNAWSGTAVNPTIGATARGAGRSPSNPNGRTSNRFTGQVLYPGVYGSNLPSNNGWTDRSNGNDGRRNGRSFYRLPGRYSYYPFAYGPTYAPYISYYGGGYPSYEGAYPYSNDVVTNEADLGAGPGTTSPQYTDQGPIADPDQQSDPARQQPAPQRQNGNAATQGTIPNNGPDSLVEAVQEELIRRGYFGGKVDAMFGPDTKEALRKFQTDHHLAETGLINEATLHALHLD